MVILLSILFAANFKILQNPCLGVSPRNQNFISNTAEKRWSKKTHLNGSDVVPSSCQRQILQSVKNKFLGKLLEFLVMKDKH